MALQEELEKQGNWLFRYRSTLPLVFLLIGILLYLRTEVYPETFFLEDTPYEIYFERICLFTSLLGLAIRIYTVGHTPTKTSGRNTKGQLADRLNTTGIYSLIRHPLYLGNFFMWLGPTLLTGNFWFVIIFCLSYWIYYERIMYAEEQFLRKKFGATYLEWAAKVPAFIPKWNFQKFVKPDLPFSWRKVVKKEKNGLVAIFLIFAFFDVIEELVERETNFDYLLWTLCALTGVLYFVSKALKAYTHVLNEYNR